MLGMRGKIVGNAEKASYLNGLGLGKRGANQQSDAGDKIKTKIL